MCTFDLFFLFILQYDPPKLKFIMMIVEVNISVPTQVPIDVVLLINLIFFFFGEGNPIYYGNIELIN